MSNISNKVVGYLNRKRRENYIKKIKEKLMVKEFTIISQNCIGGVFYHDMGMQFLSPTINLFFNASDYMKFVKNIKYYLSIEPIVRMGEQYPIGKIDDIEIYFMHYTSCEDAKNKWEIRKKRIVWDKIIVLTTDRDGFREEEFNEWKTIPYKKVLFTSNIKYKGYPDVLFLEKYAGMEEIPDIIDNREFYKDDLIISIINSL